MAKLEGPELTTPSDTMFVRAICYDTTGNLADGRGLCTACIFANQLLSSLTFCHRNSLNSFVPEPVTADIG